jgi:hypothetical protein
MKTHTLVLIALGAALASAPGQAIELGPFGTQGQGGSRSGQTFRIGPAGSVYELDGFVAVGGLDLNGADAGTAMRLSRGGLPAGLTCVFANELAADRTDLTLSYTFSNSGNTPFSDLRFFVLLDAEIDEARNTFFNEQASVTGQPGNGPADGAPDSWQIDEPGFQQGTLYQNLLNARLDNRNAFSGAAVDDVALALGFMLGALKPGETVGVRVLISEDGSVLGPLALTQSDPASTPPTRITLSGEADARAQTITEITGLVQLRFEWRLNQPVGSLIGRLRILNDANSGAAFGPPFQLGLQSSTNLYYVRPTGHLENGTPYLDLTEAVAEKLGAGAALQPGQEVIVDGVEVFSAGRAAPPASAWSLWATRIR